MTEKKLYETTAVMDGSLEDDAIKAIVEKVKNTLTNLGCEIKLVHDLGRKKLAYKIGKATIGYYIHIEFVSGPEAIAEIERQYRLNEQIIRFLTIILDKRLLEIRERVAKYGSAQPQAVEVPAEVVALKDAE
ncbi:MAG: 30S ribosomal protein S6 [Chloroherpetonaceae bacterium]|nr:30S ribosomal protein S6 [Chloroherpetonaceae bacterium]